MNGMLINAFILFHRFFLLFIIIIAFNTFLLGEKKWLYSICSRERTMKRRSNVVRELFLSVSLCFQINSMLFGVFKSQAKLKQNEEKNNKKNM